MAIRTISEQLEFVNWQINFLQKYHSHDPDFNDRLRRLIDKKDSLIAKKKLKYILKNK